MFVGVRGNVNASVVIDYVFTLRKSNPRIPWPLQNVDHWSAASQTAESEISNFLFDVGITLIPEQRIFSERANADAEKARSVNRYMYINISLSLSLSLSLSISLSFI